MPRYPFPPGAGTNYAVTGPGAGRACLLLSHNRGHPRRATAPQAAGAMLPSRPTPSTLTLRAGLPQELPQTVHTSRSPSCAGPPLPAQPLCGDGLAANRLHQLFTTTLTPSRQAKRWA